MKTNDPPEDTLLEDRVGQIADEFTDCLNDGRQPDLEEFVRRHPDIGSTLREVLEAVRATRQPAESPLPATLGGCRLLREIGRGGMGRVFEAIQEPLGRRVALKVLSNPLGGDRVYVERFCREARAAARLHHTNIVPVFGVGEQDGVHYCVMEFIDGQPLDRVIREWSNRQENPSASADSGSPPHSFVLAGQIALQTAEALAHAHEHGVLHRDVKPSNLLLDRQGKIWVADFGLAKLRDEDDLTATGDVVGTLRYLAPERLRGQIDARSDVCGLGLTLYELLTLLPAFDAADRHELVRQIGECAPVRPRRLNPQIPRDLETIVLKAMAREPERRYASAAAMADDLRCFLQQRPIAARRTSAWEHAWRWCRRNPGIATASAVAAAALLIGLSVSLWQWQRADRNFQHAEASAVQAEKDFELAFQAIDQMLERVGDELLVTVPQMDQTRRALLQDAVRFYQDLLRGREDNPKVRLATARAHCRLGQIHLWLNELDESVRHHEQALALVQDLLASDPSHVEHRRLAAIIYFGRGGANDVLQQLPDAEADYRQSLTGWDRLSVEWPDRPVFALGRAYALLRLGNLLRSTSRPQEAESFIRQSIALAEGLPTSYQHRSRLLATGLTVLGLVLEANGDSAESERTCRRALEFSERSARETPEPNHQHELAKALTSLAQFRVRDPEARGEAERLYLRSFEISERLVADFPNVSIYKEGLAITANGFGVLLRLLARRREAEAMFERTVTVRKDLVTKFPDVVRYRVGLGGGLHNLALQRRAGGDLAGARLLLEEAIGHQETVFKVNHKEPQALEFLANHHRDLTDLLLKLGLAPEAEKTAFRQRASAQELSERDAQSAVVRVFQARACDNLAQLRRDTDQFDEATKAYSEAVEHWRRLAADFPSNPGYASRLGAVLNDSAIVRAKQRRWADMIPLVNEAIKLQEAAVQARPDERSYQQFLCNHYSLRAESRIGLGDYAHVPPAAAAIRDRFPTLFDDYVWAVRLARCIPLAAKDQNLPQTERDRLAREYADESMALLRAAQQKKSKDLPQIQTQAAFQPLRSRSDFQKLIADLDAKSKNRP